MRPHAIVVLSATVTVLIGLCLGALFSDANAMNTWSSILMLPLLIGGIMVPFNDLFSLGPVEVVMRVIPTYYTAHALFLAFSARATLATLSGDLIAILVSIVLFGGLATILLRTRN